METYVQFSVFLVNKPGVMSQIFRDIAKVKANIISIAMMDSMEHGVLRLIVDEPDRARSVFQQLNVPIRETEVLGVTLPNKPGAAAELCDKLASSHVHIGYMYCTGGARGGKTLVVLKVPSISKAMKVLENNYNKGTRRDMKIKLRRPVTSRR